MSSFYGNEVIDAMLPRKASKLQSRGIVPETDTGREVEYTKVIERTMLKELGKLHA